MTWKRSLALVLLVVFVLPGCTLVGRRPPVQSPQRITSTDPPLDPASLSPVSKDGAWCFLELRDDKWFLCNIHYHRPAEHGRPFDGGREVIPPCGTAEAGTGPSDWVEFHYVFSRGTPDANCGELREHAFENELGTDCPPPFIVRAVWAKVTAAGGFKPKQDELPDSDRYAEYDGSSTGGTGGRSSAHWKINRKCVEVSEADLNGIERDPTRRLQPAPVVGKPASTKD